MGKVFREADIMLPTDGTDLSRWAVVACDQFTSEQEYWEQAADYVGKAPSTLSLILPEVYLDRPDTEARLDQIHRTMGEYIRKDLFLTLPQSMIYIERKDSRGKIRQGLVGCVDLEYYDYKGESSSLVRASEATIPQRLPARVKIRENAVLELPHIMLLIDDDKKTVIEPLAEKKQGMERLYDFHLMLGGGHLSGYKLDSEEIDRVTRSLDQLEDMKAFEDKYQAKGYPLMVYAVGDGNHSLAAAKLYYENLKAAHPDRDLSRHPARYCLVEMVNLHSPALEFEAIHRVVKDVDVDRLLSDLLEELALTEETSGTRTGMTEEEPATSRQSFVIVRKGRHRRYTIGQERSKLTVGSLQRFLDDWCPLHGGEIDYIHGEDGVDSLSMDDRTVGFLLPQMKKRELFPTVIFDGALPRKTFSMGHAQDKRYYMECRRIKNSLDEPGPDHR